MCIKIKLIGSIFPEKIEFDGKTYRTKHVNMLIDVRGQRNKELGNGKAQKKEADFTSFQLGGTEQTELELILGDLDRLYELRFWIPSPGEPVSLEWLRSQGLI